MSVEPMPVANAPKAPYVHVCESPPTISSPGATNPSSGSTTCSMPPRPTSKKCSISCSTANSFINRARLADCASFAGTKWSATSAILLGVEDAICAFDLAHHADRDGGGELVGENEVDLGVDDLPRLDAIERRVARENLLGECHAHDKSIIRRRRAGPIDVMQHEQQFGFSTRALHAGSAARPGDRLARHADLPNRGVRLRLDRAGGGALCAAQLRPHLQPHQQPHGRGIRGTHGEPRRRPGSDRILERPGRAALHGSLACAGRRSSRLHAERLRRNGHAAQRDGEAHGHRDDVRTGRRPRRGARRDPSANEVPLRRNGRQSVGRRRRSSRFRGARARSAASARRRQHVCDAVSLPADRARRRHRRTLGDEVHQRARHGDRRRARRIGKVPVG